jgi:capsular polysaccharide export protein
MGRQGGQVFLFMQGPISPFFPELAAALEKRGHRTLRVNVCIGDVLFWRRPGAVNYRGRPEHWEAFVAELMAREGVTDLVLLGEQRHYQKAAIAAARRLGIAVAVTDFGYLRPDWITLEPDGMSGESRFPRDMAMIRALARRSAPADTAARYVDSFPRQAAWDMAFHLSNVFLNPFCFPRYRDYQLHHPVPAYLGTGLRLLLRRRRAERAETVVARLQDEGIAYFVLPMQMENDFQLRAYSPYPDMLAPIRQTIRSMAAHASQEAHLVVKIHPLDPGLRPWRRLVRREAAGAGVQDRVHFIDGGSLDRLLHKARGVITVNSTVGIWGLRVPLPVIALGQAIFDIEGLTFQDGLDRFWTEARAPDSAAVADFVAALANTIQLRGVYYKRPGLDAAVQAAARRLDVSSGEHFAAFMAMHPAVSKPATMQAAPSIQSSA